MDIDEGSSSTIQKQGYVWTLEKAKELVKETTTNKNMYYDQKMLNLVREKIAIIEKLKKDLHLLLTDKHDPKILKDYLKELREH